MKKSIFVFAILSALLVLITSPAADAKTKEASPYTVGVVKLSSMSGRFGNGMCVDPECRFFLTNYHVAALMPSQIKLRGATSISILNGTDPADHGAIYVKTARKKLQYNPARDLALISFDQPLKKMHGAGFSMHRPQVGENVFWSAYGRNGIEIRSGKITKIGMELHYTEYAGQPAVTVPDALAVSVPPAPGNSGGTIFDLSGKVLGIIIASNPEEPGSKKLETIALPVADISRFLRKANLDLWGQVFWGRKVTPDQVAILANEVEDYVGIGGPMQTSLLAELKDFVLDTAGTNADFARRLKSRAIQNRNLRDVIGEQDLTLDSGHGLRHQIVNLECQKYPGCKPSFQEIRADGTVGKLSPDFPIPNKGVVPTEEWGTMSDLAQLPIVYVGSGKLDGKTVYAFKYKAAVKDRACDFTEKRMLSSEKFDVDCSGEILSDETFNLVKISKNLFMPSEHKVVFAGVLVSYGWVTLRDQQFLLPSAIEMEMQGSDGAWYRTTGSWSKYGLFGAETKISVVGGGN